MFSLSWIVLVPILVESFAQSTEGPQSVPTVNLLQTGTFTWDGCNSPSTTLNVTAENYTILATIEKCVIGNIDSTPNEEYLILKNGYEDATSLDNGQVFAYIKKPKTIYFFSSSVLLELKTSSHVLSKECTVTFEIADHEDAPLPPVTTTEAVPTYGPEVSRYSTVLISGRSIDQFNADPSLVSELRTDIATMANDYTEVEGFCLIKKIESKDVEIYTLEQCPTQWPNFDNCVRLVYAIPVKLNDSCSIWDGYQLTSEQLDIMWSRLATKYLKNVFSIYEQPEINNLVTWWIICMVFLILLLAIIIVAINMVWRRRQSIKRAQAFKDVGYIPDTRKISELSLTPPYFQPIPPMFGKTDSYEENTGEDNAGFQYDILDND